MPMNTLEKMGLTFSLNHDAPILPRPDVLALVDAAVNRTTAKGQVVGPDERISPYVALKAVTAYPAYQIKEETTKGTLEDGKLADLVILEQNPLKVDPKAIKDIKVLETIKDGRRCSAGRRERGVATRKRVVAEEPEVIREEAVDAADHVAREAVGVFIAMAVTPSLHIGADIGRHLRQRRKIEGFAQPAEIVLEALHLADECRRGPAGIVRPVVTGMERQRRIAAAAADRLLGQPAEPRIDVSLRRGDPLAVPGQLRRDHFGNPPLAEGLLREALDVALDLHEA